MKTKISTTALLAFAVASHLAAASLDLGAIETRIEHAALAVDPGSATSAASELDSALQAEPTSPALLYLRGLAYYAAASCARAKQDNDSALANFDKATAVLEKVHGNSAWTPEAKALASSIYGQIIGIRGGASGMTLGPKSGDLLAEAAKAAPGSPRVLLFRGISKFTTPPMWGGNPTEGMKLLLESEAAFASHDTKADGPHWGHADALVWIGIAKQKTGHLDEARKAWTDALALEPDYAWVKYSLLPSVSNGQ